MRTWIIAALLATAWPFLAGARGSETLLVRVNVVRPVALVLRGPPPSEAGGARAAPAPPPRLRWVDGAPPAVVLPAAGWTAGRTPGAADR